MAAGLSRRIAEATECPICTETYSNPKILPCVHSFCLKCLIQYGEGMIPGQQLPCPVCRQKFQIPIEGFGRLPSNFFMNNLIEITKLAQKCDVCAVDASEAVNIASALQYCVECKQKLCEHCIKQHKVINATKSHTLSPLGTTEATEQIKSRSSFGHQGVELKPAVPTKQQPRQATATSTPVSTTGRYVQEIRAQNYDDRPIYAATGPFHLPRLYVTHTGYTINACDNKQLTVGKDVAQVPINACNSKQLTVQKDILKTTDSDNHKKFVQDIRARGNQVYIAKVNRPAGDAKQLTVQEGEILEILDNKKNWWKVRNYKGNTGFAPYTVLTPYNENP